MAELGAGDGGGEGEVGDTDLLVHKLVGKVIATLGHGTDKDANGLVWVQLLDVLADLDNWCIKGEGNLAAVWWEMVGDWVLDDFEKLLLRVGGADRETVQELDHETSEALESTWDAHSWADLDEDTLGGGDVDLEETSLVDWRIEEGEKALEGRVLASVYRVA